VRWRPMTGLFHLRIARVGRAFMIAILAASFSSGAWAQQSQRSLSQPQSQSPSEGIAARASELTMQNLSRVAASAAQIRGVLAGDAGLLVDLKRWIARDAASHGQIVRDDDLSDEKIFERLETDVQFRAVATSLLQQYGYLVPQVNPNSAVGKEQTLLVQERTKWLAQRQEEELAAARQPSARSPQAAEFCGPQLPQDCARVRANTPRQVGAQDRSLPSQTFPDNPEPRGPRSPGGGIAPSQIAQSNQDASDVFFPLAGGGASRFEESAANLNNVNDQPANRSVPSQFAGPDASSALGIAGMNELEGSAEPQSPYAIGANGSGGGASNATEARAFASPEDPRGSAVDSFMTGAPPRYRPAADVQPVALVRKVSPYNDIPSLYDMYVQAAPRPANPTRFGAEIFENGTRDSQIMPMDLPAGPDYVVGPGDGLSIDLWGSISQRLTRTVDREGRVSLPEIGPVLVSGKSLADVQQNVQLELKSQFRGVSADISLSRLRSVRIYEVGDVTAPGAYDVSSLSTPLSALFAAGGPTPGGSMRILKHYRGDRLVQTIDVYDLLLHGVKGAVQRLENGDTVLVPPIGPQVTVEGMVRRPAVYELRDEKTLTDVLDLAGGILPIATLRHIEVERTVAHDKRTMLSLEIPEADGEAEVANKLNSLEVQDGDRVRIFPIAPYNQDAIYVEGHVVRPGKYSYRDKMRVTDVIPSYSDLLPEPSTQYAEIIHLNPPDFRPSVEGFNLSDAFADPARAPALHPMDTVRIFGRFEFEDTPTVSVLGDVRAPGDYGTSGEIHLSDAVHLAGGLAPDAATADAQVFRYLPDGRFKIFSVGLNQALAGDSVENIRLQPRDRILIHRNQNAVAPLSVFIEGEVSNPGRYPLTTSMTVADLVRISGGLKSSADTKSADLTSYEWANQTKLTGTHEPIDLSAALAGAGSSDVPLSNGDVLTIRQLPGWNDLGASIDLRGEVKHPGTYGIRPGEKLSSVLERAGGFAPDAYPFGAILQRGQVRELQMKEQDEMILRIKDAQNGLELLPDVTPQAKQAKEVALQQWQAALEELSANPPAGRVTVRISSEINRWKNTSADVEVRAADKLTVPKRPSQVLVTGQVFNATAVSYRPGKSANWYLGQAGGPTQIANKKEIFVVRADGTVIGARTSLWSGESFSAALQPGDTVVVPEKALGGGLQWQSLLLTAQAASAIASAVFIAAHY
jgi:polysaccharide export outer membrane protein